MMTLDAPTEALKNYHKSLHSTDQDFIEKALIEMEVQKLGILKTNEANFRELKNHQS